MARAPAGRGTRRGSRRNGERKAGCGTSAPARSAVIARKQASRSRHARGGYNAWRRRPGIGSCARAREGRRLRDAGEQLRRRGDDGAGKGRIGGYGARARATRRNAARQLEGAAAAARREWLVGGGSRPARRRREAATR
ncbi:hypothetical protein Scep_024775 [Stephania cephalantha]|uniref:Uncharacterized protein n=1 Tax=Stephania cephalantha TaxID=152367 RepID=A0AAP0EZY7_9MAGN